MRTQWVKNSAGFKCSVNVSNSSLNGVKFACLKVCSLVLSLLYKKALQCLKVVVSLSWWLCKEGAFIPHMIGFPLSLPPLPSRLLASLLDWTAFMAVDSCGWTCEARGSGWGSVRSFSVSPPSWAACSGLSGFPSKKCIPQLFLVEMPVGGWEKEWESEGGNCICSNKML